MNTLNNAKTTKGFLNIITDTLLKVALNTITLIITPVF